MVNIKEYPYNLLSRVFDGSSADRVMPEAFPSDIESTVEFLMAIHGDERSMNMVHDRYKHFNSLYELSENYSLSVQRCSRRIGNVVAFLKLPMCLRCLRFGITKEWPVFCSELNALKEEKKNNAELSIRNLNLVRREYNLLCRRRLFQIHQLTAMTEAEFGALSGVGKVTAAHVATALKKAGYSFKPETNE